MGIYVHVPFCASKCAYCDFYSVPRAELADAWLVALEKEMRLRANENGASPSTIYIGGGTPSQLTSTQFGRLMSILPEPLPGAEVTIEANPDDVTPELISAWRHAGVNRVSMGVQSMVDSELKLIGRRHDARGAVEAYNFLRQGGIDNISLDLIYGLPGQTLESWQYSLDRLMELHPEHLSAYMLSYEQGTRLWAMRQAGKVKETDEDTELEMYSRLCQTLAANGYEHYEISNFALPGRRAVHNSSYWEGKPYLGLGPGAHSWDGTVRRANPGNLKSYIENLSNGSTFFEIEEETSADRFNDLILISLRRKEGLDLAQVPPEFQKQFYKNFRLVPGRNVVIKDNRLIIPEEHWPVSDAIIRTLLVD